MDPLLSPIFHEERFGLVQEEDLVRWRNSEGQTCKGTAEQRDAAKQASHREASRDPQPEFRGDPNDSLETKHRQAEERREEQEERLNIFVTAKVAGSKDEDDKAFRAPTTGRPARGIMNSIRAPSDSTGPKGQVKPSQKVARS